MHSFPQFNRSIVVIFVGKFSGGQFLSGPTFWGEIFTEGNYPGAIIQGEIIWGGIIRGAIFLGGNCPRTNMKIYLIDAL